MAEAELQVSRILRCSDHFQVLQLERPDESTGFVNCKDIRRRYKQLAVLVHPDKNRLSDAEAAFKRLSEAYEWLADESAQREYLRALQSNRAQRAPPREHKRKNKRKRKNEAAADSTPTPKPKRRQRSPEEIWQEFQRQEEELARRQFHAKGFDRVYDRRNSRREASTKTNAADPSSPMRPSVPEDVQQDILTSNLDVKARNWAQWSTPSSKSAPTTTTGSSTPESKTTITTASAAASHEPSAAVVCCLLCRRKFPTASALERHEALSKLHAANLQAQKQ